MNVNLQARIDDTRGNTVILTLAEAIELRDWLLRMLPADRFPGKELPA